MLPNTEAQAKTPNNPAQKQKTKIPNTTPRYTFRTRLNTQKPPKPPKHHKRFPLLQLPNELVLLIAEQIDNAKDLSSLILTNRHLAHLLQEQDLLQHFAIIEDKESPYESKLIWAAYEGYTTLAKRLLRKDRPTTTTTIKTYINIETLSKWTALTIATRSGDEEMVQLLLESGASVTTKCQLRGKTPLHHAAVSTHGTARIVQLLLQHGADPSIGDKKGCPPMHNALLWRALDNTPGVATDMVRLMLDSGGDIAGTHCGRSVLHYAAHVGNVSAVGLLLDYGADITAGDSLGRSVLEWADKGDLQDRSEVVRALLERWPGDVKLPKLTPKYQRLARAVQRDMKRARGNI